MNRIKSNGIFSLIPHQSYGKIFAASLIILVMTVTGTLLFRMFLSEELKEHVERQIYDFAENQELYFHGRMEALHDYIDVFSSRIELMREQGLSERDIRNEIRLSVLYVRFLYSGIAFEDGEIWYSDGKTLRTIHIDHINTVFTNKSGKIDSMVYESNGSGKFLTIYKSVRWSDRKTAFAFASVPFSYLNDFLFVHPGKNTSVLLVDSGTMDIFLSTVGNGMSSMNSLSEYMTSIGMHRFVGKIVTAIEEGHSCLINQPNENARILFQRPLDYENWVMVVAMDSDYDIRLHENVMWRFLVFSLGIIVLVIGLLLYIIVSTRSKAGILSKARSQMISQQQNFEVIADNYNGGIVMTLMDGSGKILYCNQGALDIFGYTMDELRFVLHSESRYLFFDENPEGFQNFYNTLDESPIQTDVRMVKKDGTVFWCHVQGRILQDESGVRRGIWAVYDIDERKQAEEKLMQSEFFYRVSSELTSDWVFCYRFKTKTIDMPNEAMLKHGFPSQIENIPDVLIRKGYIHPDSVAELHKLIRRAERGEKLISGILRLCLCDTIRWFDTRIFVWDHSGRKSQTAIVVMRDITKEKSSEIRYVDELNFRKASLSGVLASYEFNISKDIIIGGPDLPNFAKNASFSRFIRWYTAHMVHADDRSEVESFFRKENLRTLYDSGIYAEQIEYRELHEGKAWRWIGASMTLFCSSQENDLCMRLHLNDIHRQKEETLALRRRAEYDSLLNIPNRYFYEDVVSSKISTFDPSKDKGVFAVFDVDKFKQINDTYGHQSGDRALQHLAEGMRSVFSEQTSVIGRLGGDEFSVYLFNCKSTKKAVDELVRFVDYLNRMPLPFDSDRILSVSVGCTGVAAGDTFETLYHRADEALYRAKLQGKNRVVSD